MTTRNPVSPLRTPWRSYLTQQSHHAIYCYLPAYFFFIFIFLCLTPSPIPLPFLHPVFHSPTYASPIPSPVLLILMTYLLSFLPSTALFSYLSACDFNPPTPPKQSNYRPRCWFHPSDKTCYYKLCENQGCFHAAPRILRIAWCVSCNFPLPKHWFVFYRQWQWKLL